ncbi:MAG: glycosyl transferase family 2 [Candidatus Xenobia bacterium]
MTARELLSLLLLSTDLAIFAYFLAVNTFYGVLLIQAIRELSSHMVEIRGEHLDRILSSQFAPAISMLAPAYNEEATVIDSLKAMIALQYPRLEIVLINDGSKDRTMEVLKEHFGLVAVRPIYRKQLQTAELRALYHSPDYPNLVVVDKANGGKADALNLGLQVATSELVCAMDADTLVEANALMKLVRPFLRDPQVAACGGTIRVVNDCQVEMGRVVARVPRRPLPGFQTVEYLRAFLFGRLGWNRLGGNLIISGAFGLFSRRAVIQAGGYEKSSVGEDMELVARLRRRSYERKSPGKVVFIPDPVAWTEVPETLRVLGRQRDRWHRGLSDVLWRYRGLLFRPRYGSLGMLALPYFLFFELLAPVVEALGILISVLGVALGALNWTFAVLFFLVAYGYGLVLSIMSLVLEEWSFHRFDRLSDRALLLAWAVLENVGYRQLTVWWRLKGLWKFLKGDHAWGNMERRGLRNPPVSRS